METLLTYLLKSAGLLSIFYLAYIVLLKKETSFPVNRRFLLGGIFASAVLPAIYFTRKIIVEANNFSFNEIPVNTSASTQDFASTFGSWEVLGIIYFLVTAFFIIRIASQLYNIHKLINQNKIYKSESFKFIKTEATISPFSFFQFIVYNPKAHSDKDLKMILQHEKIHAAQWHSVDILIANLTTALLWFNPLSWWYKKSVEQNLEYIADRETVAISGAKKSYQQALVKVSVADLQPALTNHFYQSFIKKRILMLNKKASSKAGLWKISLVFPLLLAFMLAFNVKTEAQTKKTQYSLENVEYNEAVSAVITRLSKQESFEKISKIFKKIDVELEFSEIEYSNEILTNIKVSFLDKETNENGVFSTSNSEGIESFEIFNNKKITGFKKVNAFMGKNAVSSNGSLLNQLGENPLYIIDGKKYSSKQLDGKSLDISGGGISISLAEDAKKRFGNEASNGVIIVNDARIIDNFEEELQRIDKENIEMKREFLQIEYGKSPSLISLNNKTGRKKKTRNKKIGQISENEEIPGKPLYVLNGEISKKEIVDLINQNLIVSVNVLKGASAISLYGKAAKDGAVIITTKILDKSKKKPTKAKTHSVGFQKFKKKTDYEIIKGNTKSLRTDKNINAFQWSKVPDKTITLYNDEENTGLVVIIDGKKATRTALKNIDPKNIEKINVIKGKSAIEEYGKEANDGVIEVTTKNKITTEE